MNQEAFTMDIRYSTIVLVASFIIGWAASSRAADNPSRPSGTASSASQYPSDNAIAPASNKMVTGTVQNVDANNSSVQIKDTTGTMQTVKVDNNTEIAREGNTIQLSELKTGDVVTFTVKNSGSTM